MNQSNVFRTLALGMLAGMVLLPSEADAKKKKKKGDEPPPVGWYQPPANDKDPSQNWAHACYFPPDFTKIGEGDRKIARSVALDEMYAQWSGSRDDGVNLGEERSTDVETVLLGRPGSTEMITKENLEKCLVSAKGGGTAEWQTWLGSLATRLTAGECPSPPLDYTMFDYLDIGNSWQRQLPICEGDKIRISGTESDRYRLDDDSDWINVAGDTTKSVAGGDYPCDMEGCYPGTLIMKFTDQSGIESIMPVGTSLVFTAPSHGTIEYRINDKTFFDNVWYKNGSIIDHTAIEVSPAQ